MYKKYVDINIHDYICILNACRLQTAGLSWAAAHELLTECEMCRKGDYKSARVSLRP